MNSTGVVLFCVVLGFVGLVLSFTIAFCLSLWFVSGLVAFFSLRFALCVQFCCLLLFAFCLVLYRMASFFSVVVAFLSEFFALVTVIFRVCFFLIFLRFDFVSFDVLTSTFKRRVNLLSR